MRAERTKNGVPLPDDTWAAIVNTAREVGVSEVSIQRAAACVMRSVATKQSSCKLAKLTSDCDGSQRGNAKQ